MPETFHQLLLDRTSIISASGRLNTWSINISSMISKREIPGSEFLLRSEQLVVPGFRFLLLSDLQLLNFQSGSLFLKA